MNIKLSSRNLTAALFAILLVAGLSARASAAGTAISSCQTLSSPGNYFLTANLTASGSGCLVISADNVAIDMKGKTITGNGTGAGIDDNGVEHDFAIIANGNIKNFQTGIDLSESGQAIISNVDSSNNTGEGIFIDRCCDTLNAVTANGNADTGIVIESDDSSLSNIQANGNAGGGIVITSDDNTIVASTVSNNKDVGVVIENCCNFVIGSKIQKNSGDGLTLEDGDNGVITSTTSNNTGNGMSLSGDDMVTASKSDNNGGSGIDYNGARFGVLSGVKANNNTTNGVNMNCRGSTASLTAKNNGAGNLVQTVSNGPCANVDLKAP
jgi:Periplasmic copper-binding protein (NosD)